MQIFIHAQFTGLDRPQLVSVGLVTEHARVFYIEVSNFDRQTCSPYVRDFVLPYLFGGHEMAKPLATVAASLHDFLGQFEEEVVLIFDSTEEALLIQQTLALADGIDFPVSYVLAGAEVLEHPVFESAAAAISRKGARHSALVEAQALRAGFQALQRLQTTGNEA